MKNINSLKFGCKVVGTSLHVEVSYSQAMFHLFIVRFVESSTFRTYHPAVDAHAHRDQQSL